MADINSLIAFVKGLNKKSLEPLLFELEQEPSPFKVYVKRTEAQWNELSKELTGFSVSGSDIYNQLHPVEQGRLVG
jgi:hypothetical protein